jgi:hypothetical protein
MKSESLDFRIGEYVAEARSIGDEEETENRKRLSFIAVHDLDFDGPLAFRILSKAALRMTRYNTYSSTSV